MEQPRNSIPPIQGSYQQPPPQGYYQQPMPPQGGYVYSYDPTSIPYQQMNIQQWNQIPADPSPYSYFWSQPDSFQPETFARNTRQPESKYNDLFFNILFWINLIGVFILAWYTMKVGAPKINEWSKDTNTSSQSPSVKGPVLDQIKSSALVGVGLAFIVNIVHFAYASSFPYAYIKAGVFIGLIIMSLICLLPFFMTGSFLFFIFPGFFLLIGSIYYCVARKYFRISAAVLKQCTNLIKRYPSIIFLCVVQIFVEIIINIVFSALIIGIVASNMSYLIYIYALFSYFWVAYTLGYVTYMTGAGLAASWYFLDNTVYFPKSPVWESFKRACTTSFGSASVAAFLLALVTTLRYLAESSSSGNDNIGVLILKCIAICILACIEAFVKWMNRYALIYCAVYGVPFSEGCRRWMELSFRRFIDVLIAGNVVADSLFYNLFVFTIVGGVGGYYFGAFLYGKGSVGSIVVPIVASLVSLCFFVVLQQPLMTMADTLFVCFAEAPERLNTSATELYDLMAEQYNEGLSQRLQRSVQ